eukprot:762181-Hanusia_phi.AAC.1
MTDSPVLCTPPERTDSFDVHSWQSVGFQGAVSTSGKLHLLDVRDGLAGETLEVTGKFLKSDQRLQELKLRTPHLLSVSASRILASCTSCTSQITSKS